MYSCCTVFKALCNLLVCQKSFKNTFKWSCASINDCISRWPSILLPVNCSGKRPALFSILSLICMSTGIQQGNRDNNPSANFFLSYLSIAHMASAPIIQPHIYNSWRSSGSALTPLPTPINECRGIKLFRASILSCLDLQLLGLIIIRYIGFCTCRDI